MSSHQGNAGISASPIRVEGLPTYAKLTRDLRFTHPRRDPLMQLSDCRLR